MKVIRDFEDRKVYQKCPECGSIEMADDKYGITCVKCKYEYIEWDYQEIS